MNTDDLLTPRIKRLRAQMLSSDIDCAFITKKEHIFYYTGLKSLQPNEREAFLIITPDHVILYHSPFIIPPKTTVFQSIAMNAANPLHTVLKTYVAPFPTIGFEQTNLTVGEYEKLKQQLKKHSFIPLDTIIESNRVSKDAYEIATIKKACQITAKTLRWIKQYTMQHASTPHSEIELKNLIDHKLESYGCTSAFSTIVAFDSHAASPHHVASSKKYHAHSVILVDMGAKLHEYCSDMTRTWMLGTPTKLFTSIEKTVKHAHAKAQQVAQTPHVTGKAIDDAARQVITQAGYGDAFIHTTGHGVGLEEHEAPHINTLNTEAIPEHAIITIEPGIYLPRKFGYRHEDTLAITSAGAINLSGQ
jgi:Xaa-Pro aminopeptidase